MKKTLLSLFISAAATASFAATPFNVTEGNTYTNFTSGEDDYDIYYTGTAGERARIGTVSTTNTPYTVYSMTFNPGDGTTSKNPSDWNLLGNFTMKIPSDTSLSEYTVLENKTDLTVNYQMGTFSIENDSSTATALINMGASKLQLQGNASAQRPELAIKTDTKFVSTNESEGLYLTHRAKIDVAESKTFTVDAILKTNPSKTTSETDPLETTIALGKGAKMQVNQKVSLVNNNLTLGDNAQFIANASTFTASNNNITIGNGAKLLSGDNMSFTNSTIVNNGAIGVNVDSKNVQFKNTTVTGTGTYDASRGGTNIDATSSVQLGTITTGSGRKITVAGSLSVSNATIFNNLSVSGSLSQTAGETTTFNRIATFESGASFSTTGDLIIKTGKPSISHAAYTNVSIAAGVESFVVKSNVEMWGGTLTLDKANAIRNAEGNAVALKVANADSDMGNARLYVNAANEFSSISADTKSLEIYLSGDASATLTSSFSVTNGAKIELYGFEDNRIFVSNYEDINLSEVFTAFDASEQPITTLYCYDGWLTSTAIPEPAEWAAIFGAMALALAIYRRRK